MRALQRLICVFLLMTPLACTWLPAENEAASPLSALKQAPRQTGLGTGQCVMMHCDTWQSDSLALSSDVAPGHRLSAPQIDMLWSSPIAGGLLDHQYDSGETVFWSAKTDRVQKLALDSKGRLKVLAELAVPTSRFPFYDGASISDWVRHFDPITDLEQRAAAARVWRGYQQEALRAYNSLLDDKGRLFVAALDRVQVFADAEAGKAGSDIVLQAEWRLDARQLNKISVSPEARSQVPIIVGMSMTHDGHLVLATLDGTVVVVDKTLSYAHYHRLSEESIWNQLATDDKGGIYVTGSKAWHKLVWTGQRLSAAAEEGAWSLDYAKQTASLGSSMPPVLMGAAEDEDRFVVVSNDRPLSEAVLLWRDDIPEDWQGLPGEPSRRVAGREVLDFGDAQRRQSRVELSPVVASNSVVFAQGWQQDKGLAYLDRQLLLPYIDAGKGLQKMTWHAKERRWLRQWTRPELASPNSTAVLALNSRHLHVLSIEQRQWVWRLVDWDSGQDLTQYVMGSSAAFNPVMLGLQLLPNGEPVYPSFGGFVHLRPTDKRWAPQPSIWPW